MGIRTCALAGAFSGLQALLGLWAGAGAAELGGEAERQAEALAGPNAVAEHEASRRLVALGDAAVPALVRLAGNPGALAPRLLAIARLREIRTRTALDALLALLSVEEDLAVRGQLCMVLGSARERGAVALIAAWLRRMSTRSLGDVPGPKESQPSTCFVRHVEALERIGDESAVAVLEEIAPRIPRIAPGGFIQGFVSEAVRQAIEHLRERAAFWADVRRHPGLAEAIGPLLDWCETSPLARLRLYEDEIVRRTARGRQILEGLARHSDPRVAQGARALIKAGW